MVDDDLADRLSGVEAAADSGRSDCWPTIVFGDADLPADTSGLTVIFSDGGGGRDG